MKKVPSQYFISFIHYNNHQRYWEKSFGKPVWLLVIEYNKNHPIVALPSWYSIKFHQYMEDVTYTLVSINMYEVNPTSTGHY